MKGFVNFLNNKRGASNAISVANNIVSTIASFDYDDQELLRQKQALDLAFNPIVALFGGKTQIDTLISKTVITKSIISSSAQISYIGALSGSATSTFNTTFIFQNAKLMNPGVDISQFPFIAFFRDTVGIQFTDFNEVFNRTKGFLIVPSIPNIIYFNNGVMTLGTIWRSNNKTTGIIKDLTSYAYKVSIRNVYYQEFSRIVGLGNYDSSFDKKMVIKTSFDEMIIPTIVDFSTGETFNQVTYGSFDKNFNKDVNNGWICQVFDNTEAFNYNLYEAGVNYDGYLTDTSSYQTSDLKTNTFNSDKNIQTIYPFSTTTGPSVSQTEFSSQGISNLSRTFANYSYITTFDQQVQLKHFLDQYFNLGNKFFLTNMNYVITDDPNAVGNTKFVPIQEFRINQDLFPSITNWNSELVMSGFFKTSTLSALTSNIYKTFGYNANEDVIGLVEASHIKSSIDSLLPLLLPSAHSRVHLIKFADFGNLVITPDIYSGTLADYYGTYYYFRAGTGTTYSDPVAFKASSLTHNLGLNNFEYMIKMHNTTNGIMHEMSQQTFNSVANQGNFSETSFKFRSLSFIGPSEILYFYETFLPNVTFVVSNTLTNFIGVAGADQICALSPLDFKFKQYSYGYQKFDPHKKNFAPWDSFLSNSSGATGEDLPINIATIKPIVQKLRPINVIGDSSHDDYNVVFRCDFNVSATNKWEGSSTKMSAGTLFSNMEHQVVYVPALKIKKRTGFEASEFNLGLNILHHSINDGNGLDTSYKGLCINGTSVGYVNNKFYYGSRNFGVSVLYDGPTNFDMPLIFGTDNEAGVSNFLIYPKTSTEKTVVSDLNLTGLDCNYINTRANREYFGCNLTVYSTMVGYLSQNNVEQGIYLRSPYVIKAFTTPIHTHSYTYQVILPSSSTGTTDRYNLIIDINRMISNDKEVYFDNFHFSDLMKLVMLGGIVIRIDNIEAGRIFDEVSKVNHLIYYKCGNDILEHNYMSTDAGAAFVIIEKCLVDGIKMKPIVLLEESHSHFINIAFATEDFILPFSNAFHEIRKGNLPIGRILSSSVSYNSGDVMKGSIFNRTVASDINGTKAVKELLDTNVAFIASGEGENNVDYNNRMYEFILDWDDESYAEFTIDKLIEEGDITVGMFCYSITNQNSIRQIDTLSTATNTYISNGVSKLTKKFCNVGDALDKNTSGNVYGGTTYVNCFNDFNFTYASNGTSFVGSASISSTIIDENSLVKTIPKYSNVLPTGFKFNTSTIRNLNSSNNTITSKTKSKVISFFKCEYPFSQATDIRNFAIGFPSSTPAIYFDNVAVKYTAGLPVNGIVPGNRVWQPYIHFKSKTDAKINIRFRSYMMPAIYGKDTTTTLIPKGLALHLPKINENLYADNTFTEYTIPTETLTNKRTTGNVIIPTLNIIGGTPTFNIPDSTVIKANPTTITVYARKHHTNNVIDHRTNFTLSFMQSFTSDVVAYDITTYQNSALIGENSNFKYLVPKEFKKLSF
jgi:hypothetical protein